jgi:hypothetical protein
VYGWGHKTAKRGVFDTDVLEGRGEAVRRTVSE